MQFLHDRLAAQRGIFNERHAHDGVVTRFSGLYSLLRLSQEPTSEEIDEASARYIEFIKEPYNSDDKDHLRNEAYFIKVFQALTHTSEPKILERLLQVIAFYIDLDQSECQRRDIITPHTILWMLEIVEHQRTEKYLCCLTARVLLDIVSRHQILFDYQEVAIIKKFNLALQNIDVLEAGDCESTPPSPLPKPKPMESKERPGSIGNQGEASAPANMTPAPDQQ